MNSSVQIEIKNMSQEDQRQNGVQEQSDNFNTFLGDINGSIQVYEQEHPLHEMSKSELFQKLGEVSNSAMSISLGILLTNIMLSINLIYAGKQQNRDQLSGGIGLANVMMNCSGAYLLQGLNQGFSSLGARAYGAGSTQLLYNYLFKAFLTIATVGAVFTLFLIFQYDILIALNQKEEVSYYAYTYALQILPGLICSFFFDCFRNYLNAIGYFNEPMYAQFLTVVFQLFFSYLLVDLLELGLTGITLATNFTYICSIIVMIVLMKRLNAMPDFKQFDKQTLFKDYYKYCKYVFPIALPMVVDIFCFEINSILIGAMQNEAYFNAHVIMCNIVTIFYSFPLGLGAAICTLISNAIGTNNQQRVKNLYRFSQILGTFIGFCFLIVFVYFDLNIANMYSDNTNTVKNFQGIAIIYRLFVVFDNVQCSMQGVLKGIGLGNQCLKMFLICYYVIGTPISCLLAFTFKLELVGFWMGFYIAITSIFSSQFYVLSQINWSEQVHKQYIITQHQKSAIEENKNDIDEDKDTTEMNLLN